MSLNNKTIVLLLAIVLATGCLHEPVDEEYFDDLSRVKGGQKPTPPVDLSMTINNYIITLSFYTDKIDNGQLLTYDPDTGSNENLYYLVYISATDPAQFSDPKLYYDIKYYVDYRAETDFEEGVDPKVVTIQISSSYHGPVYVWMTSHDGGRESDHSEVVNGDIPEKS
ncbi:MAG TPA: hypothetical protein PK348_06290 [Spirochaetota bacterium]|nr:hypothetical protein [Spirochaetota bacterium]